MTNTISYNIPRFCIVFHCRDIITLFVSIFRRYLYSHKVFSAAYVARTITASYTIKYRHLPHLVLFVPHPSSDQLHRRAFDRYVEQQPKDCSRRLDARNYYLRACVRARVCVHNIKHSGRIKMHIYHAGCTQLQR